VEGAGAKASRLSLRRFGAFSEFPPIPADASGAYRLNPQATTKLAPGSASLKGYLRSVPEVYYPFSKIYLCVLCALCGEIPSYPRIFFSKMRTAAIKLTSADPIKMSR